MSNVIRYLNKPDFEPFLREPYLAAIVYVEDKELTGRIGPADIQVLVNKIRGFVVWRCQVRGTNVLRFTDAIEANLLANPGAARPTLRLIDNGDMDLHKSLLALARHLNENGDIVPRVFPNVLPAIPINFENGEITYEDFRLNADPLPEIIYMVGDPHLISQVCKAWRNCQNSLYLRNFQENFQGRTFALIPKEFTNAVNTNAAAKCFIQILKHRNNALASDSVREYAEFETNVEAQIKELKLHKWTCRLSMPFMCLIVAITFMMLMLFPHVLLGIQIAAYIILLVSLAGFLIWTNLQIDEIKAQIARLQQLL